MKKEKKAIVMGMWPFKDGGVTLRAILLEINEDDSKQTLLECRIPQNQTSPIVFTSESDVTDTTELKLDEFFNTKDVQFVEMDSLGKVTINFLLKYIKTRRPFGMDHRYSSISI